MDEEKLNILLDTLYNNVINNVTTYQASTNSMERKIPMYILDNFFCIAKDYLNIIKSKSQLLEKYLKIQNILLTFLEQIEVGHEHSLFNAQMTYNASCSEKALVQSGLPLCYYNPKGYEAAVLDHEYRHTGVGYNFPDLVSTDNFTLSVTEVEGLPQPIILNFKAGALFEVKDFGKSTFFDNWQTLQKMVETTQCHGAEYIFSHIISTNTWYICENKIFDTPVHHIFKINDVAFKPEYTWMQVKLNLDSNNILNIINFN